MSGFKHLLPSSTFRATVCVSVAVGTSLSGLGDEVEGCLAGLARVPADLSFDVDAERVSAAVYKLRVRPRRAVPHYVVVSYPTDGRFNRKKVRRALDAFSARLTIRHVETGKETVLFQKGGMTFGEVYKWIDGRLELVVRKLFEVYLHRSEWYYCDEIELMLEVCSPVGQESYLRLMDPRLTVRERPYFQ